jgi:hypothetical protein
LNYLWRDNRDRDAGADRSLLDLQQLTQKAAKNKTIFLIKLENYGNKTTILVSSKPSYSL